MPGPKRARKGLKGVVAGARRAPGPKVEGAQGPRGGPKGGPDAIAQNITKNGQIMLFLSILGYLGPYFNSGARGSGGPTQRKMLCPPPHSLVPALAPPPVVEAGRPTPRQTDMDFQATRDFLPMNTVKV